MNARWISTLLLLAACASQTKEETPLPPKTDPSQPPAGISEEEFKALHEHTAATAPAAKGEMIQLGEDRAYLSLPPGKQAPMPAVIVIHEWWGLNDNIMHFADRIAAEGYAALAVDLYGGRVTKDPNEAMSIMKSVEQPKALATLGAAHAFLAEDPRIQAPKRGSIGWCFGGAWSLQTSLAMPIDATVIYYGHLVTDPEQLKALKGPVLGIFGNKDQAIPPASVDEFDKALTEAGIRHQIQRFDADHAFANPSSARYHQDSAAKAWSAVQAFFAENLR